MNKLITDTQPRPDVYALVVEARAHRARFVAEGFAAIAAALRQGLARLTAVGARPAALAGGR